MTNSIAVKFNGLNKRERLLISVTCVVLVVVVFFVLLIEPVMKKSSKVIAQIEQKERTIGARQVEVDAFSQALSLDPSDSVRADITELEKTDKQVTSILQKRSVNLINPKVMGQILESVLRDKPGITLQRLTSLPVQPLSLSSNKPTIENNLESKESASVYLHGFEVVLRGEYKDIYLYLRHLEELSAAFFWDSIEYQVSIFPDSEVTLRVHTLSAVEGWIGG